MHVIVNIFYSSRYVLLLMHVVPSLFSAKALQSFSFMKHWNIPAPSAQKLILAWTGFGSANRNIAATSAKDIRANIITEFITQKLVEAP